LLNTVHLNKCFIQNVLAGQSENCVAAGENIVNFSPFFSIFIWQFGKVALHIMILHPTLEYDKAVLFYDMGYKNHLKTTLIDRI